MKKFFSDFKKFISRGNIIDMAVGVIIGNAFSAIVKALTDKIIMPLINWLLSLGGSGLDSAYTFLKYVPNPDTGLADLTQSIYIDWGAFITAILNFLIIAMTLFIILKVAMKSSEIFRGATSAMKSKLTKEERAELKAQGKNPRDKEIIRLFLEEKAEKEAAAKAEEEAKAKALAEEEYKNSTEYLLKEILAALKSQEEPKKKRTAKTEK